MSKLLIADFYRLKKDMLFWVCVTVMFLFGLIGTISLYLDKKEYGQLDEACAENAAFGFNLLAGILCAAFCSLFQGEEYSSGTIRNKLITGHTRANVYLSQVFVCIAAGIMMCIAFAVPSVVVGIIFMGGFKELDSFHIFGYYMASFLVTAACVSLFSLITVVVKRKTASVAACFFVALLIIWLSLQVNQTLHLPEYTYMFTSPNEPSQYGLNPKYPQDDQRKLLEAVLDILPAGQAYQLCYRFAENLVRMIISDVTICVLSLLAGTAVFSKENIK